jgi:hypothetical protein
MLRLGVRRFILAVILAENRAAALVWVEGDVLDQIWPMVIGWQVLVP